MGYSARVKYLEASAAERYEQARFAKHVQAGEERMVRSLLARCEGVVRSLDAPCGTGRLTGLLPGQVTALDISPAMVARVDADVARRRVGDVEALTFPDRSFDLVSCVRLLQHLPDCATLDRVIGELTRVSARYLLVSYFEKLSLQHLRRALKWVLAGHKRGRRAWRWPALRRRFRAQGFVRVATRCSAPGLSEQVFVLLERLDSTGSDQTEETPR